MTDQEDRARYEDNFKTIFSKINRMLPISAFAALMVVLIGLWGSLFSLLYVDLQGYKAINTEQRIEFIKEVGEVKELIATIKR